MKAICGCIAVPPYIEILPCGLLNVLEAKKNSRSTNGSGGIERN